LADGAGTTHARAAVEARTAAAVPVRNTADAHAGRRVAVGHGTGSAAPTAAVVPAIPSGAVRRASRRGGRRGGRGGGRRARRGTTNPEEWLCFPRRRPGFHAVPTATTDVGRAPLAVRLAAVGPHTARPTAEQRDEGDQRDEKQREPAEPRRGRGVTHLMSFLETAPVSWSRASGILGQKPLTHNSGGVAA